MRRYTGLISAVIAASTLASCGGGSSGNNDSSGGAPVAAPAPAPTTKAEGAYEGTTSDNQAFQAIVLNNDQFWSMYGTKSGDDLLVGGFLQGQGSSSDGSFNSSDVRDFAFSPAAAGSMQGSYVPGSSFSGSITGQGVTKTFTSTPVAPSEFDFSSPATISPIVGAWSMGTLDGSVATLTISSSGSFTGASSQCLFSGTFAPHSSGKNVFDLALSFAGPPCTSPGQTASGIALTYLVKGGPTRQLVLLGVNNSRTGGAGLIGSR